MINKARSLSLEIFLMTNYERDELKSGEKSKTEVSRTIITNKKALFKMSHKRLLCGKLYQHF